MAFISVVWWLKAKYVALVICLCLSMLTTITRQSTDTGLPMDLTLTALNVPVDEKAYRPTPLGPTPLITCTDEDPARAYIASMSPSFPCTTKCFLIRQCVYPGGTPGEYCLFYVPDEGSLTFGTTSLYSLTVSCSDDVEPAATQLLTVTVVSNTPPTFVPPLPLTAVHTQSGTATPGNTLVYDVQATDIDGDNIYYIMGLSPTDASDMFYMAYTTGEIYATNDLLFLCEAAVDADVRIQDYPRYSDRPDPLHLDIIIDPHNTAPTITNLDTTVSYDELTAAGTTIHTLNVVDDGFGGNLQVNMRTTSHSGLDMYELDGYDLKTRIEADYERPDTRSIRLHFDINDGYCCSKTYSLTVNILDVNEPPIFHPNILRGVSLYEEDISFFPLDIWDEDLGETFTFSKIRGSGDVTIDSATGDIRLSLDLDPNIVSRERWVEFEVTDSGGLTDQGRVEFTVFDRNDNRPYMNSAAYAFGSHPCLPLGAVLGRVRGDDDDSEYENNDAVSFYGGGGRMAVTANGLVILTQTCVLGQTTYGTAYIEDHGCFPDRLTGDPATLSLTCGPCPPPATAAPPTVAPTVAPTTTPAVTSPPNDEGGINVFLAWLIPAIILGLIWLGLTIYFCWRYCRNPFTCRRRPKPTRVKPEKPPKKPKEPKVKKPKPEPAKPKPKTPPPTPPRRIPTPEPPKEDIEYTFGFYKGQFTEQDRQGPSLSHQGKPTAVEDMPKHIRWGNEAPPENLKLGNPAGPMQTTTLPPAPNAPPTNAGAAPANALAPPPKKSSFCNVL